IGCISGVTLETPPQHRSAGRCASPGTRSTIFGAANDRKSGVVFVLRPSRARDTVNTTEPRPTWFTAIRCSSDMSIGLTACRVGAVTRISFGSGTTGNVDAKRRKEVGHGPIRAQQDLASLNDTVARMRPETA